MFSPVDRKIAVTALDIAERFIGIEEVGGSVDNPQVMAMLKLDNKWPDHDEVPWCSAFVNYICWLLRLPRSKDLRARSWLNIGRGITLSEAVPGYDIIVLNRAGGPADPSVIDAPGHVGFFAGSSNGLVDVLGGNQSNSVSIAKFKAREVLGVRRLL